MAAALSLHEKERKRLDRAVSSESTLQANCNDMYERYRYLKYGHLEGRRKYQYSYSTLIKCQMVGIRVKRLL